MANKRTHPEEWKQFLQALNNGDEERAIELGKLFKKGSEDETLYRYRDNHGYISPFMNGKQITKILDRQINLVNVSATQGKLIGGKWLIERINTEDFGAIDYDLLPFRNDSTTKYMYYRKAHSRTQKMSKWYRRNKLAEKLKVTPHHLNMSEKLRHLVAGVYYIDKKEMTQGELIINGGEAYE